MTKTSVINRYIWLKLISKEWTPGYNIPSANALALHLKQKPSLIKHSLKSFIINRIIVCKTRGKCKINDDLYSIIPLSISANYNAKCIERKWKIYNQKHLLKKIYLTKNGNTINTKLSVFDKVITEKLLHKYSLFEILALLKSEPNYFSQKVTAIKKGENFFMETRMLVYDCNDIIMVEFIRLIPIEIFQGKFIASF